MKKLLLILLFLPLLFGCANKTQENEIIEKGNGWKLEKQVTKKVDNSSIIQYAI
jgi:hypothetical protein